MRQTSPGPNACKPGKGSMIARDPEREQGNGFERDKGSFTRDGVQDERRFLREGVAAGFRHIRGR